MAGEGGYAEDFQALDNAVATQVKQSKSRQLYIWEATTWVGLDVSWLLAGKEE